MAEAQSGRWNLPAVSYTHLDVYKRQAAGEIEVSSHVMADLLRRDISFDVILGGNDPTALGALAALQQAKMCIRDRGRGKCAHRRI